MGKAAFQPHDERHFCIVFVLIFDFPVLYKDFCLILSYRQNLFLLSPATSIEGEGIEFAVDKVMVNTCAGPQKAHCRLLCHRYVPPHPEINCIQVSALFYLPTLLSPFSGIKNMMSSDV